MSTPDEYATALTADLKRALDWQRALMEHYDENMLFNEYNTCKDRAEAIEAELRSRGIRHEG